MITSIAMLALVQSTLVACTARTFDYIVIGGGPAGLIVANRLSTNPSVSIAIIEAGDSAYYNPNVTLVPKSIAEFSPGLNTQVDWKYTSAPQKYAANNTVPYSAGKALGGSTVINGMTYIRAEKAQIDAWQGLGNPGWSWDALWPYYLAQEEFHVPDEAQIASGASWKDEAHGEKGAVDVAFTPYLMGQGAFDIFRKTSEALGFPFNEEVNSGIMRGTSVWPMMLKPEEKIREDAARAWYFPIKEERKNLHVFLNTTATRILWDEKKSYGKKVIATGVEVRCQDGSTSTLHAKREVILAAGALRSPPLLQQSGIGHSTILANLGVKQILNLPTVGANLQDQPANGIAYSSPTNWTGYATFATYLTAADLFGTELESVVEQVQKNLTAYAERIVNDYPPGTTTVAVQRGLLQHHLNLIFPRNSTIPLAEILWFPYANSINAQFWTLLPLSRGSVTATNASSNPAINPNFFQLDIDTCVQSRLSSRVRDFFATPPLAAHVTAELLPGFAVVPQNASWRAKEWESWIKKKYSTNTHPVASCAMMSRDLGGVVDGQGRVYGTANVRVVDAGAWAGQVSGHLTSSVYAVAGRIADLIMGGG